MGRRKLQRRDKDAKTNGQDSAEEMARHTGTFGSKLLPTGELNSVVLYLNMM